VPAFLSVLLGLLRAMRHRAEVRSLVELDEHILRDIGLSRADVLAALAQPPHRDPSRSLDAVCCRARAFANRLRPAPAPAPCC
jgi:uncharacterized protein YjiS (DUF1127 family)